MRTQSKQTPKWFGLLGTIAVFFLLAGWWVQPSLAQAQEADMGIAAFQVLGIKDKLGDIVKLTINAYQTHSGKKALPIPEIQSRLGEFGLKKLKECSLLVACFIQKGKTHLKTPYALFMESVGLVGISLWITSSSI